MPVEPISLSLAIAAIIVAIGSLVSQVKHDEVSEQDLKELVEIQLKALHDREFQHDLRDELLRERHVAGASDDDRKAG